MQTKTKTETTIEQPVTSIEDAVPSLIDDAISSAVLDCKTTRAQARGKIIQSWSISGNVD